MQDTIIHHDFGHPDKEPLIGAALAFLDELPYVPERAAESSWEQILAIYSYLEHEVAGELDFSELHHALPSDICIDWKKNPEHHNELKERMKDLVMEQFKKDDSFSKAVQEVLVF